MNIQTELHTRRSERTNRAIPIRIALKSHGRDSMLMVKTVNISRHGIRVRTNLLLEPGQAIYAKPMGGNLPSGYCRVIWSREGEAGLEMVN